MTTGTNNLTDLAQPATTRVRVWWENTSYLVLFFIMAGQALSVENILWGQLAYLTCNVIALIRAFALGRPIAEKVKDTGCLGLTVAILLIKFVL